MPGSVGDCRAVRVGTSRQQKHRREDERHGKLGMPATASPGYWHPPAPACSGISTGRGMGMRYQAALGWTGGGVEGWGSGSRADPRGFKERLAPPELLWAPFAADSAPSPPGLGWRRSAPLAGQGWSWSWSRATMAPHFLSVPRSRAEPERGWEGGRGAGRSGGGRG